MRAEPQSVEPQDQAQGNTPADLLRVVAARGAGPEELAKWMDLQERWQATQARNAYFKAMADFQRMVPEIPKTRAVHSRSGDVMYKYAALESIAKLIRAAEQSCGFSHRFNTFPREGGGVKVECIVTHSAGHSEVTAVEIPATKGMNTNAAQDHGIAITYGQRYAMLGAYGITTVSDDTDMRTMDDRAITDVQFADLVALCKEAGVSEAQPCKVYGIPTLDLLNARLYEPCKAMLEGIRARKAAGKAVPQ